MSDLSQRERELLNELAALRRRIAREETKEFSGGSAATADTFLALTDTPSSYAGAANYFARVNAGTSALVFGTVDWSDIYNKVNAGTATLGIAAFNSSNFTVSGGTVSLGTIYPRYSGVPTANAMAYWTANGTLAAATFGTAPFAQYSGTQSAGVFAYFTGTGTVTASATYGTATMPIYNGTPAANDMAYWNSANRLTNAPFGTADVVRTSSAQTIAGVKDFTNGIKINNSTTLATFTEGTWTPVLRFGTGTTGITYGTQTGTYSRIGRRVWVHCTIILTSKGSATGSADISGLPYTVVRTTNCACRWRAMSASYVTLLVLPLVSTTTLVFRAATAAATAVDTDLTDASFGNTSTIVFEATYEV